MADNLGLLKLFQEIAQLYPSYLAGRTTNKGQAYDLFDIIYPL